MKTWVLNKVKKDFLDIFRYFNLCYFFTLFPSEEDSIEEQKQKHL